MIKGVNRRIIEVTDPEPACFERVILFLHGEAARDPAAIQDQTERYLALLSASYHRKRRMRQGLLLAASLFCAAFAGGLASYVFFFPL